MIAPVAIVGGGIAGLTAAATLRRRGVPIVLFEAAPMLGGLATSVRDEDGFGYDFGAHFVTNRLAAALGAGADCYEVRRYGESVVLGKRAYRYPLGLLAVGRYLASAAKRRAIDAARRAPIRTAADWFEHQYGTALAREVALPLLEAWSGLPAHELAPAVGEQMPGSIARTIFLKIAAHLTGRAVASGYCATQPESPNVWHVYPRDGVSTLCANLAAEVSDAIRFDSRVSAIYADGERVRGLRVNDRDVDASAVVCSAPLDVVAKIARGTQTLEPLRDFRYRPMIFVNVRLEGRSLLPDVVVWTPGAGAPYFRLTEAPASMASLAPEGKTTVTCDIGAAVGDEYWTMGDEELGELCVRHLAELIPDVRRRYLGCRVMRTPVAYPVFSLAYEAKRRELEAGSGVAGLHLVGRNGEFKHLLMEDVYWRTRSHAHAIGARAAVPA